MPIAAMLALAFAAILAMAFTATVFLDGYVSDGGGASDPTRPGQGMGLSGAGKGPAPIPPNEVLNTFQATAAFQRICSHRKTTI